MATRRPDQNASKLAENLKRSVNSARGLTFALSGVSGSLGTSVNLASNLAENIAKANKATRSMAGGIGLAVAAIGAAIGFATGWAAKTKEVAKAVAEVRRETAIINAKGAGDERLATELEIANAMEREVQAAKGLESKFRKFPELQAAIAAKAAAARQAAQAQRNREFSDLQFDTRTETGIILGGLQSPEEARKREIDARRTKAFADANRDKSLTDEQRASRKRDIEDLFEAESRELQQSIIQPLGDMLGRSFADSIANGIMAGIREGNIGAGFKALAGGILVGIGELMQEIGTKSLLAAKLFQSVIVALRSFAPAGAIGPALALIAGGAALKALGASMGGGGSRGGGSAGVTSGFASSSGSGTSIIDRGLINPLNPFPSAVTAQAPQFFQPIIIGTDDPNAQRQLYRMWEKARARVGG